MTNKSVKKILLIVMAFAMAFPLHSFAFIKPIKAVQAPWLMTIGAPAYSTNGFDNRAVPNTNIILPEGLGTHPSFLASSLAISGNGRFAANGRNSRHGQFSTYQNRYTPEFFKTFADKYQTFLSNRGGAAFNYQSTSISVISDSVAETFSVSKRNFYSFSVPGNLTINNDTSCDIKGVFFVAGTLQVGQEFQNEASFDGCVFFAEDINFVTTAASGGDSRGYTPVDGFFVARNAINISADPSGRSFRVNGSLIADSINVNRTGNNFDNRAALLITYDPRYKFFFRDLNSDAAYSLREVTN